MNRMSRRMIRVNRIRRQAIISNLIRVNQCLSRSLLTTIAVDRYLIMFRIRI